MIVGKRMTKNPRTVGPDDPLSRAADIMKESRINHLPVVEAGALVGILSDTDLRNASLASSRGAPGGDVPPRDRPVREVMKTEVWSLTPEDSVEDALLVITRRKFGALPVLSGDRLVGIITKIDLLNALADALNVDDVCVCVEVPFPRDLSGFEEMGALLAGLGAGIRSCLLTPGKGTDRMIARLRLETIDGRGVKDALRAKGFEPLDAEGAF